MTVTHAYKDANELTTITEEEGNQGLTPASESPSETGLSLLCAWRPAVVRVARSGDRPQQGGWSGSDWTEYAACSRSCK